MPETSLIGGGDDRLHYIHHYGTHFKDIVFGWCGRFGVLSDVEGTRPCRECEHRFRVNEPAVKEPTSRKNTREK